MPFKSDQSVKSYHLYILERGNIAYITSLSTLNEPGIFKIFISH